MLKKIISILLILLCVGCTSNKEESSLTKDEVIMIVKESLLNSDFKQLYSVVNEELAERLKADLFDEEWSNTLDNEEVESVEYHLVDDSVYFIYNRKINDIVVRIDYKDNMVSELISFTQADEIMDISNDIFYEESIMVGKDPKLKGKLTLPKNVENPPVVLLIAGSGPSNLNEEVYALKPFEDIAFSLAENGIASVRYDKRYYDYPWHKISLAWEYLLDVESIIEQIQEYPVDPSRLFLLGHSQGGMLVAKMAHDSAYDIAGIIALSSTPRGLEEVSRDQIKNEYLKSGLKEDTIEVLMKGVNDQIEKIQNISNECSEELLLGLPSCYWKEMNESNVKYYLDDLKQDFLILNGKKDFQVSIENDFSQWESLALKYPNLELKAYDELNHMMSKSDGLDIEDYKMAKKVDEEVINDIVNWINER
ncbi:MAG: alpha/beta hydrolase family protein [Anaerorhabdus sp.]